MYWGEGTCFAATSPDLVRWTPLQFDAGADRYLTHNPAGSAGAWDIHRVLGQRVLRPLLFPRPGRFDSLLVEPGPPAVLTDEGVVLIYNGAQATLAGDGTSLEVAYQPGQALFDARDPMSPVARCETPFMFADELEQREGQVDNVCFAQGLVLLDRTWFLYYGMADSRIGCATAPLQLR
jgi:predicted GH43/DUF377 family glycosyl hydrolase